ncbi:MAG: MoxR family ATPase [Elusimicrobia bacterium]|nr:MoxR family ATPase [Elusimicrobiota bacterium]
MVSEAVQSLLDEVNRVMIGKPETVRLTVTTLIAQGHLLIQDVPGTGKTLLGITLAHAIAADFKRIQFTNDLLPSDILGTSVFNPKTGIFDFRPGPIFSNIVLTDEINRSTPKTQSALLETMNDLRVSLDGVTRPLPQPFMVIATQNPIEYHGTYPLPEAQLDRFLMCVKIGYPGAEDEKRILQEKKLYLEANSVKPVMSVEGMLALQKSVDHVRMEEAIYRYIVDIAAKSRSSLQIKLGLSPRGAIALCRAAQAHALVLGRDYCEPDDVKTVAVPVMAHRLVMASSAYGLARVEESENAVEELLRETPVP